NGLDIDGVVITDLFSKECKDGPDYDVVEIRHRDEIIKEIERSNGPGFDPATRVPRGHLLEARQMVKGGGTIANGRASLQISVVDVATGEVIASAAVEGAATDFFKLLDDLTTAMMKDLCAPRVDVTFAGSATYTRDEGTSAMSNEDHVQSAYNWSISYRNVRLGGPAGMARASVSQVDGSWSNDGRYGAAPFGNYHCAGPVASYGGDFAMVQIEKTVNGFRIAAPPFLQVQSDPFATTCSGLSGPPYASFVMSGTERATQALVDIDPVALRAGPLNVAVGPSQPYPTDCSHEIVAYHPPCSASLSWSGNVTVSRSGS
ncbi:MAG: hypothetical protein Q7J25_00905, partial [Vicinamibacterales bacterium]|nr:hypothetical protein [Vicinamibacterales bacterium]